MAVSNRSLAAVAEEDPRANDLAWPSDDFVVWIVVHNGNAVPGLAALVPTLGAALMIGAHSTGRLSGSRALSVGPLVWIGGLSYSLYLWHWPFAVLAPYVFPSAGSWVLPAAVLISVVPTWFSFKMIENPIHRSANLQGSVTGTMALGLICVSVSLIAALLLLGATRMSRTGESEEGTAPGASVLLGASAKLESRIDTKVDYTVPEAAWATEDLGLPDPSKCVEAPSPEPQACSAGDPNNPVRLVLIGDSHAMHWYPAFEESALAGEFHLQMIGKSGCNWTDEELWYHKESRVFTD